MILRKYAVCTRKFLNFGRNHVLKFKLRELVIKKVLNLGFRGISRARINKSFLWSYVGLHGLKLELFDLFTRF